MEFLRVKGGCTGSSESTLVKIPNCWKSHVMAHMIWHKGSAVLAVGVNTGWVGFGPAVLIRCDRKVNLTFIFYPIVLSALS